jgi:8-oxo-dGTP pyrophosphatase MutT (NUDIX family)
VDEAPVVVLRGSVELCVWATEDNGGWEKGQPRVPKLLTVSNRRWGGFSCPGGKWHEGETLEEAASRELIEETGCEALELVPIAGNLITPQPTDMGPPWFCMAYGAVIGTQLPREVEKGTRPCWRTPKEILAGALYHDYYVWLFKLMGINTQ